MRGLGQILWAVLLGVLSYGPAMAEGWASFYVPTQKPASEAAQPAPPRAAWDTDGVCIREILAAQDRHGIPNNLLLAIGLQEAGTRRNGQFTVWPFAVNAAGTGRLFDTRAAALDWVRERQNAGVTSIDVGCMQINLRWHPEAFASTAHGFDPRSNVDYAARFLKRLHGRTGDWMQAAGAYHSFEPKYRDAYLARLQKNILAANAKFPEFTALASTTGGSRTAKRTSDATRARRSTSDGRIVARATWGANLGGGANARFSLYSSQEIQPILPQFNKTPLETAG